MIKSWLICSLAIWLTAQILPGFSVKGIGSALKVAALFGILNWALGWFVYSALGIVSLGLGFVFTFVTRTVANAILLKLTDALSDSLNIKGFVPALIGSLLVSAASSAADFALRQHGQFGWIWG